MDQRRATAASTLLGPPVVPFFLYIEGSPTKIDYRKDGTLILPFLLEDLVTFRVVAW